MKHLENCHLPQLGKAMNQHLIRFVSDPTEKGPFSALCESQLQPEC